MQEIAIGIDQPNYIKFDDGEVLGSHPFPHIISRIDVEFNQTHVIGINIVYKCGDGQMVPGQSSMKFKNTPAFIKSFVIAEGDYLSEISGCIDNVINSIGFVTYKGYKETFGNPIGVSFRHYSPKNTFTAAKGSFGQFLNYIAFRVVPLPPQAMQQFFPQPQQQVPPYPAQQPVPPYPNQQPPLQMPPPQQPYPYPSPPPNYQQYPQQGYPQYPPPSYQGQYPPQQPYPYPPYQPPAQNQTTIIEVVDTNPYGNPYGGGYNQGYNNYYQKQGMGVGAAVGMGMLTGMAISDLTHHHHGGIYDVNVYGHHHHRH